MSSFLTRNSKYTDVCFIVDDDCMIRYCPGKGVPFEEAVQKGHELIQATTDFDTLDKNNFSVHRK